MSQSKTVSIAIDQTGRPAAPTQDDDIFEAPAAVAPVVETASGSAAIVDEEGSPDEALPERAVQNDDGSITLPLRFPCTLQIRTASTGQVRVETFDKLTFHRLVGADIRALTAAAPEAQPAVLLAKSARIKDAVAARLFDAMDASDIRDMSAVATHFFGDGRGRKTAR